MKNKSENKSGSIFKSKFVRSIFLQIVSIFLVVIIAIIAIVFFSFTSEINKSIISERQLRLENIENTISKRMEEVETIAYNVGGDKTFFIGSVSEDSYSGYEMSTTLSRYLVGNDFIEHLAYYRLSEPDTIYVSSGELSFSDFWSSYLGLDKEKSDELIRNIQNCNEIHSDFLEFGNEKNSFFSYTYPLPQFSKNPQAYVLVLIPLSEVKPILESQLTNCSGEVAIFDNDGTELYRVSNLESDIPIDLNEISHGEKINVDGKKYIVQTTTSESNGWTYVSIIRMNDMISDVAARQLVFMLLLSVLMILAVFAMFMCIIIQYKPINSLALTIKDHSGGSDGKDIIDEESLLSDTFAVLKDDSEQKQRFEAAYHEAEAANKAKSAFLSNMSHDIRTPMNAIVGMTEIAIKHSDDPDYVKDCLQKVQIASQYLLDIINNVLDMSRIESGNFELSEDVIEFPKLISEMITILNQSIEIRSQKLSVEVENVIDEKVIGDGVQLTQIFMNILSNSIKFTPHGGTIALKMTQNGSTEEGYADYVFEFSDTGIGMSDEFQKQVFETFSRDERSDISKIEGTGLGMAIAKNLVNLMGGTISCKSKAGIGTVFTVSMHMKLADNSSPESNPEKYKDLSLLVICDDEKIAARQKALFSELGVNVDCVIDTEEAAKAAAENEYSFIIINQHDDDKSGIRTVTKMTELYKCDDVTYVLAAKDLFSVEQSAAYNAGINAFIQVPLFRSAALSILDRTFTLHGNMKHNHVIDLEGIRVLLVEDNKLNREIASELIGDTKADVFEVTNGKEAVDAFQEHDIGYFDIILMDVQMPIMNGYEATAAIRSMQREDAHSIPIFAMTANTFDEDVRQVKEAGMNGHLGKPYSSDELYKILETAKK